MLAEDQVPISSRYLSIAARLSNERFSEEKRIALDWCSQNFERLDKSHQFALEDLRTFDLHSNACALILYSCYADIPPGRTYDVVFDLKNIRPAAHATAKLRFSIFFRRLPMLTLEHGHHHLAVFDFPSGPPKIIGTLPTDLFDGGTGHRLGMCDVPTWREICEHGRDQRI